MGAAILKLVAAITRDFNIMDEEEPEAVVDESDELAHIDIIIDVKRRVRNSRSLNYTTNTIILQLFSRSNWPITLWTHKARTISEKKSTAKGTRPD